MVIVGALAALCVAAPPVGAAGPYIALGDSVGAGGGASTAAKGYVGVLFSRFQGGLGVDQLLNRSVGGATSASMNSGQLPIALNDINAASDTQAVTIDIGGNDYLGGSCQTTREPPTCMLRPNLASALSQVNAALAADPGTEAFIVMAYYNPGFGTASEATYDTGLLGANHAIGLSDTGADVGLNDVIYQDAAAAGIPVADPYPLFKPLGQSLMADSIHPNDAGHKLVADAFCAVAPAGACPTGTKPVVDTTAPETTITTGPPKRTKRRSVSFSFTSSEPTGAMFQCALDYHRYAPCGSPHRLTGLKRGSHTFRVSAIDAAGNIDQLPATATFRVKRRHHHGR